MPAPAVHPAYTIAGYTCAGDAQADAQDEVCDLQMDCDRAADWLRSIANRDPEDYATPGWRAELRKLVIGLDALKRGFS